MMKIINVGPNKQKAVHLISDYKIPHMISNTTNKTK